VAYTWLVTAADQQGARGERSGGALRKGGQTKCGRRGGYGVQQPPRVRNLVFSAGGARLDVGDARGDLVCHLDLTRDLIVAAGDGEQGAADKGRDVPSEDVMRVTSIQRLVLNPRGINMSELFSNLLGDQVLVDALLKIRHSEELTSCRILSLPPVWVEANYD
jgi:hypothetical protein